tara:strand:- start:2630 stop:3568 length:939 start_codon:yes stop_codon:yes gene_type:complete
MKKILIAGGAGFIGSHLSKKLLGQNNKIICLDNFFTGFQSNIDEIKNSKNFEFIKHDIIEPIDIEVDEIYNLACPASPLHYQSDPIFTTKTSVIGTLNLLDMANKYDSKYLFTSTSEVYGDPLVHPQKENYLGNVNPIGLRSCYDEGKRCAESIVFDYHRKFKTKVKIARIFNTYGPNMAENDGRVVSNFVISTLKNNEITVFGDGSQTRCFCYVSDMVDGLINLMNTNDKVTGPINIGSDIEMTVLNLANKVKDLVQSNSKIIFKELPTDDPKIRKPDLNNAKKYIDWEQNVALEDGLKETINYFNSKFQL